MSAVRKLNNFIDSWTPHDKNKGVFVSIPMDGSVQEANEMAQVLMRMVCVKEFMATRDGMLMLVEFSLVKLMDQWHERNGI